MIQKKLMQIMKDDPKEAIKIIENEPKLLEILLTSEDQLEKEKSEKIKYINMTRGMEIQLQEAAKKLKTTQGLLIGAGIFWLLSNLKK